MDQALITQARDLMTYPEREDAYHAAELTLIRQARAEGRNITDVTEAEVEALEALVAQAALAETRRTEDGGAVLNERLLRDLNHTLTREQAQALGRALLG